MDLLSPVPINPVALLHPLFAEWQAGERRIVSKQSQVCRLGNRVNVRAGTQGREHNGPCL